MQAQALEVINEYAAYPIEHQSSAEELMERARSQAVASTEDVQQATEIASRISVALKRLEEERKSMTGPINDGLKQINSRFKSITTPLDTELAALKKKILAYNQEQERLRREDAARLQKEADEKALAEARALKEQGKTEEAKQVIERAVEAPAPVVAPTQTVHRGDAGGTSSVRKTWTFAVEDLSKVPLYLMSLNEKAVREAIRDGQRDIPGLRIYQEESLAIRT